MGHTTHHMRSSTIYSSVALMLMADLFSADELAEPSQQNKPVVVSGIATETGTTKLLVLVFLFLAAVAYSATLFKPNDGVAEPLAKSACLRISTEEFTRQMEDATESSLKKLEKSKAFKQFKQSPSPKAGLGPNQFDVGQEDEDAVD